MHMRTDTFTSFMAYDTLSFVDVGFLPTKRIPENQTRRQRMQQQQGNAGHTAEAIGCQKAT
jgi:hypothetical protein